MYLDGDASGGGRHEVGWSAPMSNLASSCHAWLAHLEDTLTEAAARVPSCGRENDQALPRPVGAASAPSAQNASGASRVMEAWLAPEKFGQAMLRAADDLVALVATRPDITSLVVVLAALRPELARLCGRVVVYERALFGTGRAYGCRLGGLGDLVKQARAMVTRTLGLVMQAFVDDGCGAQACIAYDAFDVSPLYSPFVLPARTRGATVFDMVGSVEGGVRSTTVPGVLLELVRMRPRGAEPWLIVEVGVLHGETTEAILSEEPEVRMVAVDPWEFHEAGYDPPVETMGRAEALKVMRRLDRYRPRIAFFPCRSVDAAPLVARRSAHVVYLDGDHRYTAVEADIAAWAGVVAPGGVLAGHDYSLDFPGVMLAARGFAEREHRRLPRADL